MSLEQEIRAQFSCVFKRKDWKRFKRTADYYFDSAATLKTDNLRIKFKHPLLLRNIQKRLFLGIGSELILKAFYLKKGFYINKPLENLDEQPPYQFENFNEELFNPNDTLSFRVLSQQFKKIHDFQKEKLIEDTFKITKVYRNKEAHIVTKTHKFEYDNYRKIQNGITEFYKNAFNEILNFKISMKPNQNGSFNRV